MVMTSLHQSNIHLNDQFACDQCHNVYARDQIQDVKILPVCGDPQFTFTCASCTGHGNHMILKRRRPWVEICYLAFINWIIQFNPLGIEMSFMDFIDVQNTLYPFVQSNFDRLCVGYHRNGWKTKFAHCLTMYPDRFQYDPRKAHQHYWRLINYDFPHHAIPIKTFNSSLKHRQFCLSKPLHTQSVQQNDVVVKNPSMETLNNIYKRIKRKQNKERYAYQTALYASQLSEASSSSSSSSCENRFSISSKYPPSMISTPSLDVSSSSLSSSYYPFTSSVPRSSTLLSTPCVPSTTFDPFLSEKTLLSSNVVSPIIQNNLNGKNNDKDNAKDNAKDIAKDNGKDNVTIHVQAVSNTLSNTFEPTVFKDSMDIAYMVDAALTLVSLDHYISV